MIGGATTSKAHTAVKIQPGYSNNTVVYVPDASRSVSVASKLLGDDKDSFAQDLIAEYNVVRDRVNNRKQKSQRLTYEQAIAARPKLDWKNYLPPIPQFTGTRQLDNYPLRELIDTIDWTPFFITWDLHGKFPAILHDEVVGEQARELFKDAQTMLEMIVAENWLEARAVIGFWPAACSNNDDIRVFDQAGNALADLHHMRQQMQKRPGEHNFSLADFIAPENGPESGPSDYIGGFCVTTGHGVDERVKAFEAAHDDYNAIMLKSLADRLAEAFAEHLHKRVRTEFWGYAPDEALDNDALIKECYRGIRPAPGYPACPDHTEKDTLFSLLSAEQACGVSLTESMAMYPTASVSGWYFSHPDAKYFSVGKIGEDQVASLAQRKRMSIETLSRWLAPNLD